MTARRGRRRLHLPPVLLSQGMRLVRSRCLNPSLPWQVQRARLDQFSKRSQLPPGTTVSEKVIGGVPAEVVSAAGPAPQRTVIHFHGGGYCIGSGRMSRSWAAHLSFQAGCRVVLPEYRLAPEHRFPAALHDGRAVMSALLAEVGSGSLVVSGDSAGAGLALALVLRTRDSGGELPAGCVLLSPWLDLGRDRRAVAERVRRDIVLDPDWLDACARAYADPAAWSDGLVSPIRAEHGGLPPLLIQAGTEELLAQDAGLLAAGAAAAGVDVTYTAWPGMWHDFALQAGLLSAADSAVAQAAWFIGKLTAAA
jgi:epsilon-lactone hydrolase